LFGESDTTAGNVLGVHTKDRKKKLKTRSMKGSTRYPQ